MSENEMLILNAKQEIQKSFQKVKYPKSKSIFLEIDDDGLGSVFLNKHWRDISPESLTNSNLNFFSPEGFQFFIPAFLLAALDEENFELRDYVVMGLSPEIRNENNDLFLHKISACTESQLLAIRLFLQVVDKAYRLNRSIPALHPHGFWLGSDFPNNKTHC